MTYSIPKFVIKANVLLVSGLVAWGGWTSHQNKALQETIEQLTAAPGVVRSSSVATSYSPPAVAAAQTTASPACESTAIASASSSAAQDTLENIEMLNVMSAVDKKYSRLLSGLNLDRAAQERLQSLLLDRERILNTATSSYYSDEVDTNISVDQHNELLEQVDTEVASLLEREDYENYELFKESGLEQYQLTQFEESLGSDASLTDTQANQLLVTKLRHKREFMEAVSLAQQVAETGDIKAATYGIEQAVENYQQAYLQEVEPLLSGSQYSALSDFEVNEFEDIHDSLVAAFEEE